jgi:nondiscriminating glutamyl-tRNA synthetase
MRVRFAPSPTGQLHVGNARTALFNWLLARGHGGTFILRIEDTDFERSTTQSATAILEDLRWMGLTWDEGVEVGGDHGPYHQSERLHIYRAYIVELMASGHAYHCFCSAGQLETDREAALKAGKPPKYVGRCRNISKADARRRIDNGEKAVVRFRVPDDREVVFNDIVRGEVRFATDVIGDPVLVRSDGIPAYNYAVVVDDALMAITHVIRGEDHISNTPRQILLYEAFGWTPPAFAHVSLVMGPDHSPLSKRHGATSVAEFRARGYLPEALTNYLALLGWSPGQGEELLPLEDLARRFRLEDVGHAAGVFDIDKLAWVNRHYLKQADPDRLANLSLSYLRAAGWVSEPDADGLAFLAQVVPTAASSVDRLEQVPARLAFLFDYSAARALEQPEIRLEATAAQAVIEALAAE